MSILIDKFLDSPLMCNAAQINGSWYIAKPIGKKKFRQRLADALRVLWGFSIAVHYKEDELKELEADNGEENK